MKTCHWQMLREKLSSEHASSCSGNDKQWIAGVWMLHILSLNLFSCIFQSSVGWWRLLHLDLPARLRCQYSCLQPIVRRSRSARKRTRVISMNCAKHIQYHISYWWLWSINIATNFVVSLGHFVRVVFNSCCY